jgi:hypothetical protein
MTETAPFVSSSSTTWTAVSGAASTHTTAAADTAVAYQAGSWALPECPAGTVATNGAVPPNNELAMPYLSDNLL